MNWIGLDYFKLLPLLSLLVFVVPRVAKGWVAMFVSVIGVVAALAGALGAILGFSLPCIPIFGPVSAVFVLAIGAVAIGCSVYAVGYLRDCKKSSVELNLHYVSLVALIYSMFFVLGAKTKFDFLIFWELMTLSSFVLIMFNALRKDVLHAAVGYLIIMHIAFFFIFYPMINSGGDSLFGSGTMPLWAWSLFFVGFGIKAGVFPFHIWLPVAYPIAPSHVSALMSGGMINMGLYGIVKATFAAQDLLTIGYVMFIFGVISAIYGILKASTQGNLKKLFAYSSIENVGIILIGLGLGAIGKASANMPLALIGTGGALLHMLNHAGYKSSLFLCSGATASATGTNELNKLGGLLKRMPITGVVFLVAVLGICAIPPFSGFFSEFMLLQGMFEAVTGGKSVLIALVGIVVLALVGGMTILTFCKAYGVAMLGRPRTEAAENATEVNGVMIAGFILPILGVIAGGLLFPILILPYATTIFNVNADIVPLMDRFILIYCISMGVLVLAGLLVLLKRRLQKGRNVRVEPTWGCGFENIPSDVQYGAHSCSAEIENAISSSKGVDLVDNGDIYPTKKSFTKKEGDKTNHAFTHFLTNSLRRWTARLALFQTGKVNHYILHALIFILLVLGLSIISIL